MSQRRWWPVSQQANKHSRFCSVCHATFQLHLRDGLVHRHGPRNNPCPGSQQPPFDALVQAASQASHSQPDSVTAASFQFKQTGYVASGHFSFSPVDCGIIKHIPKSARAACASHLCGLLNSVVSDPRNLSHWQNVLHFYCAKERGSQVQCGLDYREASR